MIQPLSHDFLALPALRINLNVDSRAPRRVDGDGESGGESDPEIIQGENSPSPSVQSLPASSEIAIRARATIMSPAVAITPLPPRSASFLTPESLNYGEDSRVPRCSVARRLRT